MARYQLPKHTSGVFAPSGECRGDDKGVIELADNAPQMDHEALLRAGCVLIAETATGAPSGASSEPATQQSQTAAEAPDGPRSGAGDDVSGAAKPKP